MYRASLYVKHVNQWTRTTSVKTKQYAEDLYLKQTIQELFNLNGVISIWNNNTKTGYFWNESGDIQTSLL